MLTVTEFCDFGDVEAIVMAVDIDRAKEIFKLYLVARGVDADDYLYRDFQRKELGVVARTAIDDAFSIGREGLVVHVDETHWAFITPIGASVRGRKLPG